MHAVYEKLTKELKIGPMMRDQNGQVVPKPYQEYPKWVTLADGETQVVVENKKEELAALATDPTSPPPERDLENNNAILRSQNEELKKQLEELQAKYSAAGGSVAARVDEAVKATSGTSGEKKGATK